jgi:hypothetical protein
MGLWWRFGRAGACLVDKLLAGHPVHGLARRAKAQQSLKAPADLRMSLINMICIYVHITSRYITALLLLSRAERCCCQTHAPWGLDSPSLPPASRVAAVSHLQRAPPCACDLRDHRRYCGCGPCPRCARSEKAMRQCALYIIYMRCSTQACTADVGVQAGGGLMQSTSHSPPSA